jgi:hypothetical protein
MIGKQIIVMWSLQATPSITGAHRVPGTCKISSFGGSPIFILTQVERLTFNRTDEPGLYCPDILS